MGTETPNDVTKCRKCGERIIPPAAGECCEGCGTPAGKLDDPRRRTPGVSEPATAAVATRHDAERRGGNGGER